MKTKTRSWIIRSAFVLVLVLLAVLMLRIGRGHTIYFDNRALEYQGATTAAPYKITVIVNGEQISKLYEKERCSVTNIGDKLELTVEVMQQKGGSETTSVYSLKVPHDLDGVIINLPGSTKAATENWEGIVEALPHAVKMMAGEGHNTQKDLSEKLAAAAARGELG